MLDLEPVDETGLKKLLNLAVAEASPEEVVAPLPGAAGWTALRKAWFLEYHRTRRTGLDGSHREITYLIVHEGRIIGSARLARITHSTIEAGLWLVRSARGRGLAAKVLLLLRSEALANGAAQLIASTTTKNTQALSALRKAGAVVAPPDLHGRVRAKFSLQSS